MKIFYSRCKTQKNKFNQQLNPENKQQNFIPKSVAILRDDLINKFTENGLHTATCKLLLSSYLEDELVLYRP